MRNKEKLFSIALVFVFLVSISATASAKEIVVGNDSEADFRSIQEAVNSSFPGATVIVRPGNYTENIVVNVNNLTIMSESKNYDVLVEPLNESNVSNLTIMSESKNYDVLVEPLNESNVSNLTIMSESKNYDVLVESLNESGSVFLIKVDNVTISGFNITGDGETFNSSCGICLENA